MSSNKTNVNTFSSHNNQNHQSVIIATNIENISLITHIIYAIKRTTNVTQIVPSSFSNLFIPIFETTVGLRMLHSIKD